MYMCAAPEVRPLSIFIAPDLGAIVSPTSAKCLSFVSLCVVAYFFLFLLVRPFVRVCVCVTCLKRTSVSHRGPPRSRSGFAD